MKPPKIAGYDGFTWLVFGISTFAFSLLIFLGGHNGGYVESPWIGIFLLANVPNSIAAYLLFRELFSLLANIFQKIVLTLFALVAGLFAAVSTVSLMYISISLSSRVLLEFTFPILSNSSDAEELLLLFWLPALPAQILVFFIVATVALVLRYLRRKNSLHVTPSKRLISAFYMFMVLAAAAVGFMFFLISENFGF